MSTDSDRRRDLRRALLDGVVDELDRAREDLCRFDAESVAIFDRMIDRSAA